MRAVIHNRYGTPDVLQLADVERPVPKEDEILVRIHAASVTRTDCGLRSAKPFMSRAITGLRRPKRTILGMEFAGEVEAVGTRVREFHVGERVFGVKGFGANAEFVCVRETAPVAHMPAAVTFEEAAAVCDGVCMALSCLRKTDLRPGRSVLVYGASGSIGVAAVQLLKHFELDVTAVCNTKNVELVRSLGADEVIDYEQTDFTKNGKTYDVILDAVGKHSFRRSRRSLKPGGIFITTDLGFMWHAPLVALLTLWIGDKRSTIGVARYKQEDVLLAKELVEAGKYQSVIDRSYPLEDVIEATRYVETGQKTGNVVLVVDGGRAG
jgi:NADPH:quinone reductase-like Zn-dependent oxidoreductase